MLSKKTKIKSNNKEETEVFGKLLNKLKKEIISFNNFEQFDKKTVNKKNILTLQKLETLLDQLLIEINNFETLAQKEEKDKDLIFVSRQLEILIDYLLFKIENLDKNDPGKLFNKTILLQTLKKKVIDNTLMLAKNHLKTVEELIFSKLTQEYMLSIDINNDYHLACMRAIGSNADEISGRDEKSKLIHLETNEKAFKDNLIKYTLSNGDKRLYNILCSHAFSLHSLLQKENFKKIHDSRKFIEKIKYTLSKKQVDDFINFERLIEKNKNRSETCKQWLDITDSEASIACISIGNNYIFKLTDENDFSFVFMCTKIPQENISALYRLQHSAAKKYLAPEWYATSYHNIHSLNPRYHRYSLTSWCQQGDLENFAVNLMLNDQLSLEEKQKKIILLAVNIITMILNIRAAGIIFPDIKPSNILLDDENWPYLSDIKTLFITDLSKPIDWSRFDVTESYIPPEQVMWGNKTYQSEACLDLDRQQTFMVGIMLYQIMHGWNAKKLKNVMAKGPVCYTNEKCHLPFDKVFFNNTLGNKIKILIQEMVLPQVEKRPTLSEAYNELSKYLKCCFQLYAENNTNSLHTTSDENTVSFPLSDTSTGSSSFIIDEFDFTNIENSNKNIKLGKFFNPALITNDLIQNKPQNQHYLSMLKKQKAVFFQRNNDGDNESTIKIVEHHSIHNSIVSKKGFSDI